ncbi:MAG: hypothetical protein ACRDHW_23385, partial [Ktedonobacteraceae bacterium]
PQSARGWRFATLPTLPLLPRTQQAASQALLHIRPLVYTRIQLVHLIDRYVALVCLLLFFAAVCLLDYVLFQEALFTLILTMGACLVVFSNLLARWLCWYAQLKPRHAAQNVTAPLQQDRKPNQFSLLRADTMNYLRAIRFRKGIR